VILNIIIDGEDTIDDKQDDEEKTADAADAACILPVKQPSEESFDSSDHG